MLLYKNFFLVLVCKHSQTFIMLHDITPLYTIFCGMFERILFPPHYVHDDFIIFINDSRRRNLSGLWWIFRMHKFLWENILIDWVCSFLLHKLLEMYTKKFHSLGLLTSFKAFEREFAARSPSASDVIYFHCHSLIFYVKTSSRMISVFRYFFDMVFTRSQE